MHNPISGHPGGRGEAGPAGAEPHPHPHPDSDPQSNVRRLLEAGKCKQAVEAAKEIHKRLQSADSERLLVDAYFARIEQFLSKGASQEAGVLVNLVRQRFPASHERLAGLAIKIAAAEGKIDELVAPLAGEQVSDAVRQAIEGAIRGQLTDPAALAGVATLPADHPLRLAAAAVARAFEAVTAGPVTDEQIALPEVSRRSPLAGWKLIIRALAAFYRRDDEECRRALAGIAPGELVHRLAAPLTAMLDRQEPGKGLEGTLRARVGGDDKDLRSALGRLDQALQGEDFHSVKIYIRQAAQQCAQVHPELLERLQQDISVRCAGIDMPVSQVLTAMGASLRNARFWRLFARTMERKGSAPVAALYWERFLVHAISEGMFAESSIEDATVLHHMAAILSSSDIRMLQHMRRTMRGLRVICQSYNGQPPHIAALAPRSDDQIADRALDPEGLFSRAAGIDPHPAVFEDWWKWMDVNEVPDRNRETVAMKWQASLPGDPRPLLHLSDLAEKRNALSFAMKHLAGAEALDPLNPLVRQARVRLTLATLWRHFKAGKVHLVEKDLADLDGLAVMKEGSRAAYLAGLRAAWHVMRGEADAARSAYERVVLAMGELAAGAVMHSIEHRAGLAAGSAAWPDVSLIVRPDPLAVADAAVRISRLMLDMGVDMMTPAEWDRILTKLLREPDCPLPPDSLLLLGKTGLARTNAEMAYAASVAGLSKAGGAAAARFLLLRARCLPAFAGRRISQCLRAALVLAQQAHDTDLLSEVSNELDRRFDMQRDLRGGGGRSLSDELLAEVLKNERSARKFPVNFDEADRHVVAIESETFSTAGRRGPFGGLDMEDDDFEEGDFQNDGSYDDDDDFDDELPSPFDFLENVPPEIMQEVLKSLGARPGTSIGDLLKGRVGGKGSAPPGPWRRRDRGRKK